MSRVRHERLVDPVLVYDGLRLGPNRIHNFGSGMLEDDGQVDPIAIEIWTENLKRDIPFPRLTTRERRVVCGVLFRRGMGTDTIAKYMTERGHPVNKGSVFASIRTAGLSPNRFAVAV